MTPPALKPRATINRLSTQSGAHTADSEREESRARVCVSTIVETRLTVWRNIRITYLQDVSENKRIATYNRFFFFFPHIITESVAERRATLLRLSARLLRANTGDSFLIFLLLFFSLSLS